MIIHLCGQPDGSQIAFVSNRENNNNDIFVMNADGSNIVNITNNGANDNSPTGLLMGHKSHLCLTEMATMKSMP